MSLGPRRRHRVGRRLGLIANVIDSGSPAQEPRPLPYLSHAGASNFDIALEVWLSPKHEAPACIARSNTRHLYWTMAQQLAHHTVNGCNLRPGDVCASGTISGPTPDSYGSMLELAWKGTKPIEIREGVTRTFIQDGDTVTMRARVDAPGVSFALGEVTAEVVGA